MTDDRFQLLDRELWLQRALARAIAPKDKRFYALFAGRTDPAIRQERARAMIEQHQLADQVAEQNHRGKPLTYAQAFKATYRVRWQPAAAIAPELLLTG